MPREIKFRVWSNYEKKYIGEWGIFPHIGGAGQSGPPSGRGMPYIHEQFTGLRDKNGKEIYEGDICHYWQSIDGKKGTGFHRNLVVDNHETGPLFRVIGLGEWEGPYTVYKMAEMLTPRPFNNVHGNLEIIGNIHEHPELLKAAT